MRKSSAKIRFGLATAIVAAALICFASAGVATEAPPPGEAGDAISSHPEKMAITGTIEAVEENFLGRATQVRIVSPDMGTFLIANAGKGEDLTGHVGETVTVVAQRTTDGKGNQVLAVEGYKVHEG